MATQTRPQTAREINRLLDAGKTVIATVWIDGRQHTYRITRARTYKGELQGRALSSGRWRAITETWEAK